MNIFKQKRLTLALLATFSVGYYGVASGALLISQTPLFVLSATKANVLLIFSNSNAMDEDPTGLAVGSNDSTSKSEIARIAARNLVTNYTGRINMGLMAYQQSGVVHQWLNQSPYDISFDPATYDPAWTGARDSATHKKFKIPNSSSPNVAGACTTSGGTKVDCVYYNVNLPYYTATPQGNSFCYSATTGATTPTFPGDHTSYQCYATKTGFSNAAPGVAGAGYPTGVLFSGTFGPTESDFAQNIDDFGQRLASSDQGPTWFANGSPGLGYLHVPIVSLDTVQAGKINVKLATSVVPTCTRVGNVCTWNDNPTAISGGNTPTNPNAPLINAGLSPITGTFRTAKDYFNGATTNFTAAQGGPQAAPIAACGHDFVVLLTNGLPSRTASGGAVTYSVGQPFSASEVVNAVAAVTNLKNGTRPVETYVIGFALPEFTNNYFVSNPPNPLDQMAVAGGTFSAFFASDLVSLNSTFSKIFSDILAKTGSAAAVATNTANLQIDNYIFQAKFQTTDWSGQLVSLRVDTSSGSVVKTEKWDAAPKLDAISPASRVILTKGAADGVSFEWANLTFGSSTSQQTLLNTNNLGINDGLGSARLDYLRGETSNEGTSPGQFRARNASTASGSILGDIVNSGPLYVGAPKAGYSDVDYPGYAAFRARYLSRKPVVYVGANDGMLHGFDAQLDSSGNPVSTGGNEVIAYVPSQMFGSLSQLTAQNYNQNHRYMVDGTPMSADVYLPSLTGSSVDKWRTVLIGNMNSGGKGYFALDITNPNLSGFSASTFSAGNAADLLLWEFTDADDTDMGYAYNLPPQDSTNSQAKQIVRLQNGNWVAVVGNGYNSTNGRAVLYLLNIEKGIDGSWVTSGDFFKVVADSGPNNGLSTPVPYDSNGDGMVDVAYAGDLLGNMWRFDISTPSTPVASLLFSSGTTKPITTPPVVFSHPSGGNMVLFGTGKYLELTDNATAATQTIYGIRDSGSGTVLASALEVRTMLDPTGKRTISGSLINWTTKQGWLLDLPASGERLTGVPKMESGNFFFNTLIPSTVACESGGTGWLMAVDSLTGAQPGLLVFDGNKDGVFNNADLNFGGMKIGAAIGGTTFIKGTVGSSVGLGIASLTNGELIAPKINFGSLTGGRVNWREILQ
ncbi:MAG: Tfp pilus assembly protein, tip-associated adhesin PilY1 [Candidatus Nitrotoga sp. SPKER]|nr:MAG: Tfp pilus assembly protein, tip-associated adhesin PilY1 [Candidatus Nitrotoga sp. SPKER]